VKIFIKIISISAIIFFALIAIIFIYRKTSLGLDSKEIYSSNFFLIIFLFLLISIINSFLKVNFNVYLLIIMISIIMSFYMFEIYLGLSKYHKTVEYHAKKKGEKFDDRSKYEFYLDYKKLNKDAVISIPPFMVHREYSKKKYKIKNLPLAGFSNRKTVFCNESGYFVDYLSDRYGFNNPDIEWNKKKQILFLGDSYTHGVCVSEKNTITGNLRSRISKDEFGVISLGQRGNGPLSEYASLVEYSKVINPKIIFWMYYEGNDLKNLKYEKKIDILNSYLIKSKFSQNLVNKQDYLNKILEKTLINRLDFEKNTLSIVNKRWVINFLKLHHFRRFIRKIELKKDDTDYFSYKNEIIDFKTLINKTNYYAMKNNAKLIFVYIPSYKRTNKNLSLDKKLFNYEYIIKVVEDLNISIIDLNIDLLQKSNDPLSFYPYGLPKHFNEWGYKTISNIIYQKTKKYIN